ncbi:hypothetical protein AGMMS50218_05750 [Actinomycetota bacterium]|nr:hypothetical protein AGMMS50218_05750 [Actinomycetota bacterium]
MSPRRPDARAGLPDPAAGLSRGRRWTGLVLAVVGLPVLTLVLERVGDRLSLGSMLLLYLLAVVVVAVVGGIWPAVLAALGALLAANWFFTPPFHTLIVSSRDQVVEFAVFAVVSVLVSVTVDLAARARAHAARSQVEARLLTEVATAPLDELSLTEVLDQVRTSFGMTSAALVRTAPHGGGSVVAAVGEVPDGAATIRVHASGELDLVAHGPELFAEDRTVLQRLAAAAARAWEGQHLAVRADQLVEVDRVRSALLAAVGHDLRTPLSGLKAAVSSLRQEDVEWSDAERDELLGAIESSADRLTELIANLLDMTRIQVGAVTVDLGAVALDEVVALATLDVPADQLRMSVPDDLPLVLADVVLLERVVANLVDNARRHSPPGSPVELAADVGDAGVELRVIDHGPGVPADLWPVMFEPFQRLGDRATGAGAGLGLAIVRGFCDAMQATVRPGDTPGGGLTMTVTLTEAHA